jgi:integrase
MIHRQNWLDVRAYLHYMERVRQNDSETIKRARSHLRHLLEWANDVPFPKARHIDPTFPTYLLNARADGKDKPLASASVIKCLAFTRQFFVFARREWPLRYKPISESWIEMLQPPRHILTNASLLIRQYYTLDDVLKIASTSTDTLHEERGKVAVCMLFLSGMRADTLASLPISCVDISNRTIRQIPSEGVRTKNSKAAITYLLNSSELSSVTRVVTRWDELVRASLPPNALWYSTLTKDGMTITPTTRAFEGRNNVIERDVRLICTKAGMPYMSPHKLKHGHVVYARSLARTPEEIKAISQNAMHSNSIITDQIYGRLTDNNTRNLILGLGQNRTGDLEDQIAELIEMLKERVT